mmetsp:Transcript_6984/g.6140  ORF Transcript_6984/g.6140 Transcript_6984/m.6140 type:complete len:154 (+) Transcript_6984:302-763(+)|eukprot:CAMPEP_0170542606 /NCGR_PEP_ID=MMETSP0211-20121228/1976_1 /TAXON_ID=311385 /ORGANISM="Pseudokeronopsis sp., Strain OXSARD2" /LENGTH=153 /DNA_ID=CAMNT_0010845715 /DNA_START=302 /DNA_END=766 /DNA_ORIENTATION=+
MAVISSQLLLREFEILMWFCVNQKKEIEEITKQSDNYKDNNRQILNRLLMTGYFIKKNLAQKEVAEAIEGFFSQNFPQFIGKYTTWSILSEPNINDIKGPELNLKFKELKEVFATKIQNGGDDQADSNMKQDFNELVEQLGEESSRIDQIRKQ